MKKYQIGAFITLLCALSVQNVSFSEPANLGILKQELRTYHDSGAYKKEFSEVLAKALSFVDQKVKNNQSSAHPKKLAVVLDIDETTLSNYKKIVNHQFHLTPAEFQQATLKADAPPIKAMLSFYDHISSQGISVFFVTGRLESLRDATTANLNAAGFHDWQGLYLKPVDYKEPSNIPFKSGARAKISQEGYTVIASIGDQYSDLKGGYAEKTFKLPNPYYYLP